MKPTREIGDPCWQDIDDRDQEIERLKQIIFSYDQMAERLKDLARTAERLWKQWSKTL